jgi:membrane-bound serine protease (ClpP class)
MALLGAILLAVFVVPSPWGVPLVAAGAVVEAAESWLFIRWSRRRRVLSGPETMVGAEAVAVDVGSVRIDGELWRARARRPLEPGEAVRVEERDGLTLVVRPLSD